jgi:S-adenosylmethionine:tRNA ribosyltransferase-isomerase
MLVQDFWYDLPEDLIAHEPIEPRDAARLMVIDRTTGNISHHHVRDLPGLLPAGTFCVANNSRVRNARLEATHASKGIPYEILVLEPGSAPDTYCCMLRGKAIHPGDQLVISEALVATCLEILETPGITTFLLSFSTGSSTPVHALLQSMGELPLPPYIQPPANLDPERYQTTYASKLGSAAAPTAGLHITPELRQNLAEYGHIWHEVTLHVGIGTFLPLREDDVTANELHTEATYIPQETAAALNQAIEHRRPILTIGTTSLRTLEGHYNQEAQHIASGSRATNIFIYPGIPIRTATTMLTNFHLPKSSLLMLVAAMLSQDSAKNVIRSPEASIALLHEIYATAVRERYRFFSFGDAMLIL